MPAMLVRVRVHCYGRNQRDGMAVLAWVARLSIKTANIHINLENNCHSVCVCAAKIQLSHHKVHKSIITKYSTHNTTTANKWAI